MLNNVSVQNKRDVTLGSVGRVPGRTDPPRGQHAPSGATMDATDEASAVSHRALGTCFSKFTTRARAFSPLALSFPRRSVSDRWTTGALLVRTGTHGTLRS